MRGRRAIKLLATKKGQRAKDMLVMAEFNDPFYVGSETQCTSAEWVRELYLLLRPKRTVHIRRLHYFALTQPQQKARCKVETFNAHAQTMQKIQSARYSAS